MRRVKTHQLAVLVRNALKHFDGLIGPECLFAVPRVVKILITILDVDGEAEFTELGLFVATSSLLTLADLNAFGEGKDSSEAGLTVLDPEESSTIFNLLQVIICLLILLIRADLAWQKLRAIEADALEDFGEVAEHALVVNGAVQGDMTEMTRARIHTYIK